ncbi:MAG: hypothetical protein JWO51_1727 [Rhodospirillales bacterium]|nr:hypothetical protein [Rhodospirillales bacterium]
MPSTAALPSEADIATLMHLFYLKVEHDTQLGAVYAAVFQDRAAHNDTGTVFDRRHRSATDVVAQCRRA